jgi:Domain of unknown function (DUF5666)
MTTQIPAHEMLDDARWPTQGPARRIRLRPFTAFLAIGLIAVAGIYGGAELQQRNGSGSVASGASASGASARAGGLSGRPGGGSAGGGATTGTVTEITAKTLYVTSSSGKLITVELTSKTTFTRTAKTAKSGIALGDTAIVRGTKNASGTLVATSVIATAKGVTSTFGAPAGGFSGGAS